MPEPLVSIITPTYNHSRFIGACIDSLLAQNYSNWEQIIVDDGSNDDTGEIVSKYTDPRIRYMRQSNLGPFGLATTYNRALGMAKGELVAILEGDDFWPPNKLATLVPAFLDPQVVLAYGEAADVNANGEEQQSASCTTRLRRHLSAPVLFNNPVATATRHMLLVEGRSLVSPSTVVLRRRTLELIGGFQSVPGLPLTDYPTFIELSLIGTFHYTRQIMGYRRRHEDSITVNHARTIYEKVSEIALQFLTRHQNKIVLSVSERKNLEENWRQAQDKLHFSEGRSLLLRKMWAEARSHFRSAFASKAVSVRVAAIAGVLFSHLHMDIERLMILGGRSTLRERKRT